MPLHHSRPSRACNLNWNDAEHCGEPDLQAAPLRYAACKPVTLSVGPLVVREAKCIVVRHGSSKTEAQRCAFKCRFARVAVRSIATRFANEARVCEHGSDGIICSLPPF